MPDIVLSLVIITSLCFCSKYFEQKHRASTYHSTDLLTARGVAHLVVHGTSGLTSYETIPHVRLESSGGVLSTVDMVVQRRDDTTESEMMKYYNGPV